MFESQEPSGAASSSPTQTSSVAGMNPVKIIITPATPVDRGPGSIRAKNTIPLPDVTEEKEAPETQKPSTNSKPDDASEKEVYDPDGSAGLTQKIDTTEKEVYDTGNAPGGTKHIETTEKEVYDPESQTKQDQHIYSAEKEVYFPVSNVDQFEKEVYLPGNQHTQVEKEVYDPASQSVPAVDQAGKKFQDPNYETVHPQSWPLDQKDVHIAGTPTPQAYYEPVSQHQGHQQSLGGQEVPSDTQQPETQARSSLVQRHLNKLNQAVAKRKKSLVTLADQSNSAVNEQIAIAKKGFVDHRVALKEGATNQFHRVEKDITNRFTRAEQNVNDRATRVEQNVNARVESIKQSAKAVRKLSLTSCPSEEKTNKQADQQVKNE
ncbi:hypothetical protein NM208_g78 [Fusarium decemcellulare]|uniref:Uncharacterized protein n=2 Tax=Fusarium decemcellulare TaxID=57161 RepID=A0ACC1SYN9_9HYPO|nr:hypothetical protein NM208_g636 [Fusarium decemcellulare]KAJ3550263.1 hypothetical protein NM208_g78 [Fusarium decemcellulare]